jgi:hypothetical protein
MISTARERMSEVVTAFQGSPRTYLANGGARFLKVTQNSVLVASNSSVLDPRQHITRTLWTLEWVVVIVYVAFEEGTGIRYWQPHLRITHARSTVLLYM